MLKPQPKCSIEGKCAFFHMLMRVPRAVKHSVDGLRFAWMHEMSLRLELIILICAVVIAQCFAFPWHHQVGLLGSLVLVIIMELQNTAIEKLADRVTKDHDPLIKIAKDCSSAAVFLSVLGAMVLWSIYLLKVWC